MVQNNPFLIPYTRLTAPYYLGVVGYKSGLCQFDTFYNGVRAAIIYFRTMICKRHVTLLSSLINRTYDLSECRYLELSDIYRLRYNIDINQPIISFDYLFNCMSVLADFLTRSRVSIDYLRSTASLSLLYCKSLPRSTSEKSDICPVLGISGRTDFFSGSFADDKNNLNSF